MASSRLEDEAVRKRLRDDVRKTNGCWLWQGEIRADGYGVLFRNGYLQLAHRLAYRLHHGNIPKDRWVVQTCRNHACVCPEHLALSAGADAPRKHWTYYRAMAIARKRASKV